MDSTHSAMPPRAQPERRVPLMNAAIKLDFDPRTSDTMYNYIRVRRGGAGEWDRLHSFGVDVRVRQAGEPINEMPGGILNAVGMCRNIRREGNRATTRYPTRSSSTASSTTGSARPRPAP